MADQQVPPQPQQPFQLQDYSKPPPRQFVDEGNPEQPVPYNVPTPDAAPQFPGAEAAGSDQSPGGAPSPMRRGLALGLGGIGAQMFGHALSQMSHDSAAEGAVTQAYKEEVAPMIKRRWEQQDAEAFHALVVTPYATQLTKSFQTFQHRAAQLDQGILEQPDGGIVQIDPQSQQALKIREGFVYQFMQTQQALDSQLIRSSTSPKWSGNSIITDAANQLIKHRTDFAKQFTQAHMDTIDNESKMARAASDRMEAAQRQAEAMKLQIGMGSAAQEAKEFNAPENIELRQQQREQQVTKGGLENQEIQERITKSQWERGAQLFHNIPADQMFGYLTTTDQGRKLLDPVANELAFSAFQADAKNHPEWAKQYGSPTDVNGKESPQWANARRMWNQAHRDDILKQAAGEFIMNTLGDNPAKIDTLAKSDPSSLPYLRAAGYGQKKPGEEGGTTTPPPRAGIKVESPEDQRQAVDDTSNAIVKRIVDNIKTGVIPQPKDAQELTYSPQVRALIQKAIDESYGEGVSNEATNRMRTGLIQQVGKKLLNDRTVLEYTSEERETTAGKLRTGLGLGRTTAGLVEGAVKGAPYMSGGVAGQKNIAPPSLVKARPNRNLPPLAPEKQEPAPLGSPPTKAEKKTAEARRKNTGNEETSNEIERQADEAVGLR